MSCLLIRNNLCYSKKIKYSNHLNTRRVWYLTGPNIFGCQIVWFLIGGLKTGQKHMFEGLKCLATRTFPFWFWMVRTMNQKRLTIRNPNTFRFWAPTLLSVPFIKAKRFAQSRHSSSVAPGQTILLCWPIQYWGQSNKTLHVRYSSICFVTGCFSSVGRHIHQLGVDDEAPGPVPEAEVRRGPTVGHLSQDGKEKGFASQVRQN